LQRCDTCHGTHDSSDDHHEMSNWALM
jgi:hypothetical protein